MQDIVDADVLAVLVTHIVKLLDKLLFKLAFGRSRCDLSLKF